MEKLSISPYLLRTQDTFMAEVLTKEKHDHGSRRCRIDMCVMIGPN